MKILITGDKGFLGKRFYDKFSSFENKIVSVNTQNGGCSNYFKREQQIFDLVIHCAAFVEKNICVKNKKESGITADLILDAEMVNWAVRTNQKKIVYISSSSVYPVSLQTESAQYFLKEEDVNFDIIKKPDSTYGWTKLTGEFFAEYLKSIGIKVLIFRPFTIYGIDQGINSVFNALINGVQNKSEPYEIWGNGNQVRDFIYVDDAIDAMTKIIELETEGTFNIGSGIPISINEMTEKIFKIAQWRPTTLKHLLDKDIGVNYRCSDNTKMKRAYEIKYQPEDIIKMFF